MRRNRFDLCFFFIWNRLMNIIHHRKWIIFYCYSHLDHTTVSYRLKWLPKNCQCWFNLSLSFLFFFAFLMNLFSVFFFVVFLRNCSWVISCLRNFCHHVIFKYHIMVSVLCKSVKQRFRELSVLMKKSLRKFFISHLMEDKCFYLTTTVHTLHICSELY